MRFQRKRVLRGSAVSAWKTAPNHTKPVEIRDLRLMTIQREGGEYQKPNPARKSR